MDDADRVRLHHMLDAVREALSFIEGKTRSDLDDCRMLVLSLVKEVEIIGEAGYRLSESARNEFPEIPWADVIGMRNRLVHAYFDINHDILWQTLVGDLPLLIPQIERALCPRTG